MGTASQGRAGGRYWGAGSPGLNAPAGATRAAESGLPGKGNRNGRPRRRQAPLRGSTHPPRPSPAAGLAHEVGDAREWMGAMKSEGGLRQRRVTGPYKHASTPGRSRRLLHRGSASRKKNGDPALTNHAAAEPAALPAGPCAATVASQPHGTTDRRGGTGYGLCPDAFSTTRQPDDPHFRRRRKSRPRPAQSTPAIRPITPETPETTPTSGPQEVPPSPH